MKEILPLSALVLLSLSVVGGCSSNNKPSVNSNDTSGTSTSSSSGGTSSTSSTSTSSTGGSSSSNSTTGTSTDGGAGASGEDFTPACDLTLSAGGEEIKKGTACTDADPEICWRKCGPQSSGWKSETCTSGVYAEGDCVFPSDGNYECYKIPDTLNAACPTTTDEMPQASQECDVPECNPCNVEDQYMTSSGEVKVGYCVCQPENSDGTRTWSCASGTAWPCPLGQGC